MADLIDKYHDVDVQASAQVKADLRRQGIRRYPATCDECRGTGHNSLGKPCRHCKSRRWYWMEV